MDPELIKKKLEYEERKARAKELRARLTCTICGARPRTLLNCPCGTTQYCSTECQRIDWRERGHRAACKKIRNERATEAAQAEAPTPSPPEEIVYGPAPRSHADEVRARIAAEHEAARARREANPEPAACRESRCPICLQDYDANLINVLHTCCCRSVCFHCHGKVRLGPCPLCRAPCGHRQSNQELLARLHHHVDNDTPEAINSLGQHYEFGKNGLVKSAKKAAKIYKRAVELGHVDAMLNLAKLYATGDGVKLDKKKMMQLYRNAGADRGDAYGQYMLGLCLIQQKQAEEGLSYMRLAAEQGLILSCTALGMIYEAGQGDIERDTDEARRWFELAVAKGNALENARFSKENKLDSMKPTASEAISDAREAIDRLGANDASA